MEEVIAEEQRDIVLQLMLAGHERYPILVRSIADAELIDIGFLHLRLTANAEHPVSARGRSRKPELSCRCAVNETDARARVEHHADLLAVDHAVHDRVV